MEVGGGNRGMIRGCIQAGRRQDGGEAEAGRRQVGEISIKRALECNTESGISESGFKKIGIQIIF
jgi:hypothetical protein